MGKDLLPVVSFKILAKVTWWLLTFINRATLLSLFPERRMLVAVLLGWNDDLCAAWPYVLEQKVRHLANGM